MESMGHGETGHPAQQDSDSWWCSRPCNESKLFYHYHYGPDWYILLRNGVPAPFKSSPTIDQVLVMMLYFSESTWYCMLISAQDKYFIISLTNSTFPKSLSIHWPRSMLVSLKICLGGGGKHGIAEAVSCYCIGHILHWKYLINVYSWQI